MKILPEPLSFEWDSGNLDKNLKRHNVSCQEAEEALINEPLLVAEDIKHSIKEKRFQALGRTNGSRYLFLSITIRDQKVRIISVRDMNKKEKVKYEKI